MSDMDDQIQVEDTTTNEGVEDTSASVDTPDEGNSFEPITSQEEFDKRLGKRLGQERAKYADYDDLKAAAARVKELEEAIAERDKAALTDEERSKVERDEQESKIRAEMETLTRDNASLLRENVALAKGLPAKWASRLAGETREELEADANELLESLPKPAAPPKSQKPTEDLKGGGKAGDVDTEPTADEVVAKLGDITGTYITT